MSIEIVTFEWVPGFAQGYVRDLRPRWALSEAGLDYTVRTLSPGESDGAEYRALQPFGQVPAYRDEDGELFESGAIVLRIARRSETLKPRDAEEDAAVEAWTFAALNSVEPRIDNLVLPDVFHAGEEWVEGFRPVAERLADMRLAGLDRWLEGREWLTGRFSVADIVMATVLRGVEGTPVLARHGNVAAYLERCLARPSFRTALDAQLATFAENEPARAVS